MPQPRHSLQHRRHHSIRHSPIIWPSCRGPSPLWYRLGHSRNDRHCRHCGAGAHATARQLSRTASTHDFFLRSRGALRQPFVRLRELALADLDQSVSTPSVLLYVSDSIARVWNGVAAILCATIYFPMRLAENRRVAPTAWKGFDLMGISLLVLGFTLVYVCNQPSSTHPLLTQRQTRRAQFRWSIAPLEQCIRPSTTDHWHPDRGRIRLVGDERPRGSPGPKCAVPRSEGGLSRFRHRLCRRHLLLYLT